VFRTADGGASWIAASPLPGERAPALLAVAVTPGNADVVYAGTAARGLFKSANGGRSWQAINAVSSRRACRLPAPG
jgi:photosystem II stability/assembly factor-like uncharacterized protein